MQCCKCQYLLLRYDVVGKIFLATFEYEIEFTVGASIVACASKTILSSCFLCCINLPVLFMQQQSTCVLTRHSRIMVFEEHWFLTQILFLQTALQCLSSS